MKNRLVYLALVPVVGLAAAGVWMAIQVVKPPAEAGASVGGMVDPKVSAERLEVARSLVLKDRFDQAEVVLREALREDSTNQEMILLYAEVLLRLGRSDEAYERYEEAIFIGPDHAEYRHAAGTLANQIGRVEDAEAHFAAAQDLDPRNPKYPLYLAQIQRKLGKVDEARVNLVLAAKLDPDLAMAWGSLAALALEGGKREMALHYVAKARELEPGRTVWRVTEAKAQRGLGRVEEALALLYSVPEAERLADPTLLVEIALCHGLRSEPGKAAEVYVEAARADAGRPEYAYEAALWFERAGDLEPASMWASIAAHQGHEGAARLVAKLGDQTGQ